MGDVGAYSAVNIDELAKQSTKKEAKSWAPAIPLAILAPLLVVVALIAAVVPTSVILNEASHDSTEFLANKYMLLLLDDVQRQAQAPVASMQPVAGFLANLPDVTNVMTTMFTDLRTSTVIPVLAGIREQYQYESVVCVRGRWRQGYENSTAVNLNVVNTTFIMLLPLPYPPPPAKPTSFQTAALIVDEGAPNRQLAYFLDKTTRMALPGNASYNAPLDPNPSRSVFQQVGRAAVQKKPFFSLNVNPLGLRVGYIAQQKFVNATDALPTYSCSAGFRLDTAWNDMLVRSKPTETSVVALFDSLNFTALASSNMIVDKTAVVLIGGIPSYGTARPDELTLRLRESLRNRFHTPAAAFAAGARRELYIEQLSGGKDWIVSLSIVAMSSYEEENILLVATLPRSEIYGVIDKARHRSTAVSVGIMAGMSLLVSALFVVAVLPLFKLAREMAQLTKLDFGTLEESGALEQRSFLWELRKVQATFATMVKAFAGAIKKNKEMQSTRGAGQNSRTTGTDHGGGGGGRVASQAGPPVQSTRALVDK